LSLLGTEIVAVHIGADPASEPDAMRYDPTSTTACQTETAHSHESVVLCQSPFGFHGDTRGPSDLVPGA
jgi:hypothetical protein